MRRAFCRAFCRASYRASYRRSPDMHRANIALFLFLFRARSVQADGAPVDENDFYLGIFRAKD
jgi:hypothetical protein